MKRRIVFIAVIVLFSLSKGICQNPDSSKFRIMPGFLIGYDQNSKIYGGICGSFRFNKIKKPLELKLGINYSENITDFDGVTDLEFQTLSVLIDASFYLVKNFYAGLGFTADYCIVEEKSQEKYQSVRTNDPPEFFSGVSFLGQVGYCQPIFKNRIYVRIQGQIGVRSYNIANGSLYFSNNINTVKLPPYTEEFHVDPLYNVNIGLGYRIK